MPRYEESIFGTPCWIDLTTTELEQVKPFYSSLFNWDFWDIGPDFGNYHLISVGEDVVGGCIQYNAESMDPVPINAWSIYFATEDIEASITRAVELGGKGYTQAHEVGDQGTRGEVTDPSGALLGLWQPNQRKGIDRWGEHGFPGWFELHTRNLDAAGKFYTSLLGTELGTDSEGDMSYHTLNVNGNAHAGIWDITGVLPNEYPARWNIYLISDDTDASLAIVRENGGNVLMEPEDTPHGRMSTVEDPAGATFNIISGTMET